MNMATYGVKLLQKDSGSLYVTQNRIFYPENTWIDVPGNGAYIYLTGGVKISQGALAVVALFECENQIKTETPIGVACFSRVFRLPESVWLSLLPELNQYIKTILARFSTNKAILNALAAEQGTRTDIAWNANTG